MSYFVGAKCNDGDHIGEGDPKSKDDDIDTTNGKLSLSILGRSLFPKANACHKRRSNRTARDPKPRFHVTFIMA